MLNSNLLNKINVNDEWYTQEYAIKPILEFLKPNSTILCPFDKIDSEFVCVLEKNGHKVWNSHIDDEIDFFNYIKSDVDRCDYIISNPPFSKRKQVIKHLFNLGKPFAMLIPLVSIALKPIREKIDQCELLIFNKRIKFIAYNGIVYKNPPSETAYICHNVLPKQIVYIELKELLLNIMLKVIELFAGIGSQRKALKNIGINHKVVAFCDNDKYAEKSYRAIFNDYNTPNLWDIIKLETLPYADLITWSFPCQDISNANNNWQGLNGKRSGLAYKVVDLIKTITKPKYLLMENVQIGRIKK